MKLPLRYFILVCLILGAVGLPWAWRTYQARRAAELKKAEVAAIKRKLAEEYANQPPQVFSQSFGINQPPVDSAWQEWERRVSRLEDRLESLTGRRPTRPAPQQVDVL